MRLLLATSAALLALAAAPSSSMARDYPWCSRTSASGFTPSCSFTSFRQCMATVSGQAGDCTINPLMAYGQYTGGRRARPPANDWSNDGWNNRW
jgi:hypothetical protein